MIRYLFFLSQKMFSVVKKVFLVIFVFGLIIGFFSHFIQNDKPQIQYDPVKESRKDVYKKLNDPELNKSFPTRLSLKTFRVMACAMAGEACTDNPDDGDKNFQNSIFGKASQIMALPYTNPPASGTYWAMDTLQHAGLAPKTYAAEGIGFASIKPLMNLWKVFRDVTYMLLVLFLVAIGFMIMFRVKINPQTVISVENSLPKIAVSMILITFSFAIAGFMIDLMYVLIALAISILSNNGYFFHAREMTNAMLSAGPGKIHDGLMGNPMGWSTWSHLPLPAALASTIFPPLHFLTVPLTLLTLSQSPFSYLIYFGRQFQEFIGPFLSLLLDAILGVVYSFMIGPKIVEHLDIPNWAKMLNGVGIVGNSTGNITERIIFPVLKRIASVGLGTGIAALLAPILLGLLFFFTILYTFFRIFALLFTAYLQIILLIIFSPILIVLELLPGSKMGFAQWLKNLLGELSVFLVVAVIFLVSHVLYIVLTQTMSNVQSNLLFTPPFIAGIDPKAFAMLISLGLSLLIPDFTKQVKEALGAKGVGVNFGLGTFFGGVGAGVGGTMGMLGSFSSIALAMPGIRKHFTGKGFFLSLFGDQAVKSSQEASTISTGATVQTQKSGSH